VVQTLLSQAIIGIYYWTKSTWMPKLIFKIEAIKELWSYSMNMFISGLLNTSYEQLDSIIIGKLFSITDLGLYARAKSLNRFVIKFSSESIGNVTFPAMAAFSFEKDKLVKLGIKAEILVAFVSWGLLGYLYVTAESLFLILFGQKWVSAIPIYKLLCLSGFAYPISAATLSMLKASGDSKTFLKLEIYKKIVGLIFTLGGLYIGFQVFLISLIISGFIGTILNIFFTAKSLEIEFKNQFNHSFIYFLPALAAVLISMVVISFLDNIYLEFVIASIMFGAFYLGLNYIFKTKGLIIILQRIPKRK
jgi:O-antigen/teichoic acid export membrane protein